MTTPVKLLFQALKTCAKHKGLIRRVEDGRLHEEQIMVELGQLGIKAGVPVEFVEFSTSNYPLSMRDQAEAKPKDYHFVTRTYLETDGQLLGLHLRYAKGDRAQLDPKLYASREALEKEWEGFFHHAWRECTQELAHESCAGVGVAVDPVALSRDLEGAMLAKATPSASRSRPSSRL